MYFTYSGNVIRLLWFCNTIKLTGKSKADIWNKIDVGWYNRYEIQYEAHSTTAVGGKIGPGSLKKCRLFQ